MADYKKYQKDQRDKGRGTRGWSPEYKKFRVRSSIKSFRDLEVYKQTTQLSTELFQFELPETLKNRKKLDEEIKLLYELSKNVPRLIAECYGDKFTNFNLAKEKLEKTMQLISNIITKIDFLVTTLNAVGPPAGQAGVSREKSETLTEILKKYQRQRTKILNLKNAWCRLFEKR